MILKIKEIEDEKEVKPSDLKKGQKVWVLGVIFGEYKIYGPNTVVYVRLPRVAVHGVAGKLIITDCRRNAYFEFEYDR